MSNWKYKPKRKIRNFKDLEIEKQRLELHQQFLEALLERDKLLLKKSLSPQNILSETMGQVFSNFSSDKNVNTAGLSGPYGIVFKLIRLFIKKVFS